MHLKRFATNTINFVFDIYIYQKKKLKALQITNVERTCYIQGDCKTDRLNKFNRAAVGPIVRLFSYRTYHAVLKKKLWMKLFNMSNVLLEGINKKKAC